MSAETPTFLLYEHATGYSLFRVKEFEDIGNVLPQVEASINDKGKFSSIVKLISFTPFQNAAHALENCNAVSEGIVHPDLLNFLETNIPKEKKSKVSLGVADSRIGASINESLPHIKCVHIGIVPEILRGVRIHFPNVAKGLSENSQAKAQLGLGHSYSRAKVKFNVHRVDNMIIQAIALLDQLDKDINTFSMRIREWYSYHFPELYKVVPDQYTYCRCAKFIKDRKNLTPDRMQELMDIVMDEEKVHEIYEVSRSSMGMDISPVDLINIERFTDRVVSLGDYRKELQDYLKQRMHSCAPNLAALIGEQVGARLISKAGSLTNLAKCPASTIQILGAEKALFRALKTRGATPKFGLLFHSTFIGRAAAKNKGRISRYLANKCAIASRIDCFSDVPVEAFGEHMKQQVEDRLKYFETGECPKKNLEVMHEAMAVAAEQEKKVLKKRKKKNKKDAAAAEMDENLGTEVASKKKKDKIVQPAEDDSELVANGEELALKKSKKKKKNDSFLDENSNENDQTAVEEETAKSAKKKRKVQDEQAAVAEPEEEEKPKKKKKKNK